MSEWREVYLNEAYSICSGISKPAKDFGSGFPFLSFKDVFNNFFIPESLSELVESTDKERESFSIKRGDVFLTRTSETVKELGMSCVALKDYENATFNGFTKRLRPNNNFVIVPEYAGYYFRTSRFRSEVTAMSSASTRASLNNEMLGRLKIILPSEKEQKQIADILSCLDNKIDNLRRQNETLEKIAQTLFKHWFINFEFPNDDGKPYKSSGGAMVASELGDIPAGWRVGKMQNIIEVRDGTHDSPKQSDKGFKLITSKHLKKEGIDFDSAYFISDNDYIEINKRSKVETFDILLSMIGTVGLLYFVQEKVINFSIKNIGLFKTSQNLNYSEFIYLSIKSNYGETYLKTRLAGTTQSYVTLGALRNMPLIVPSSKILSQFKQIAKSIFDKDYFNKEQIKTLTKTRDTLLPKLMSGQIRIKEGKSIMEEVK